MVSTVPRHSALGVIVSLKDSGQNEEAFSLAKSCLNGDECNIEILIYLGEISLDIGWPEQSAPVFAKFVENVMQNSWALSTYERVLQALVKAVARQTELVTDALVSRMQSDKIAGNDVRGPATRHFDKCMSHGLSVDPRVYSLLENNDHASMGSMKQMIFSRDPGTPVKKDRIRARLEGVDYVIVPSANIYEEKPVADRKSIVLGGHYIEIGSKGFCEVENATVFMLPGAYGLVQFSDGSFYNPLEIGAFNAGSSSFIRRSGDAYYYNLDLISSELRKPVCLSGENVLSFRFAATYFFHFMTEMLSSIYHLTGNGYEGRILVPSSPDFFSRFSRDVFSQALAGFVSAEQRYELPDGIYRVERLLIPRNWTYGDFGYAERLMIHFGITPDQVAADTVILLRRRREQGRALENDAEVLEALRGCFPRVQGVFLEEMSLPEQIRVFRSAILIVSPHGGGLANIVFCRKGTKLIELHHRESGRMYWDLSYLLDIDYLAYFPVDDLNGKQAAFMDNFVVETGALCDAIEKLFAGASGVTKK